MSGEDESDLPKKQIQEIALAELHLPPDIKAGIETSINEIEGYVAGGGSQFILEPLSGLLEHAAKALDSDLEFTSEGRKQLEETIATLVDRNLQKGVKSLTDKIAHLTGHGQLGSAELLRRELHGLVGLAKSRNIYIDLGGKKDSNTLIKKGAFLKPEEVDNYVNEVISNHLLEGIAERIKGLGELIAIGSDFSYLHPDTVVSEINKMWHLAVSVYGFEKENGQVMSELFPDNIAELSSVKKINLDEIQDLIDKTIAKNLAKGLNAVMLNFGKSIANLPSTAIFYPVRDVVKDFYETQGLRLGLVDSTLSTITSEEKINLEHWDKEVEKQVIKNFDSGLKALVTDYRQKVKTGRVGPEKEPEKIMLDLYIDLGKKYEIVVDRKRIQEELVQEITPENIQLGLEHLLQRAKESVRSGYIGEAEMIGLFSVPGVMEFIELYNLSNMVNTKPLLDYLKSNGIVIGEKRPRLGGHTKTIDGSLN